MTTRFHAVSHGKITQFEGVLAAVDMDDEMIDLVIAQPRLAGEWVDSLRVKLRPPSPMLPTFKNLFRTPEQLFEAFKARNTERKWGFTDEQVRQLREQMPTLHKSTLQRLLTLRIWLGELSLTFEELWSWNKDVHDATWRWDYLKSDKKHLRLLNGRTYGKEKRVEWIVIDVTANRGEAPKDVCSPSTSPDVEILAAAALHPDWPKAINYDTIPSVWLPGLQASALDGGDWMCVPRLSHYDRDVFLGASWCADRYSNYAVPVFREL